MTPPDDSKFSLPSHALSNSAEQMHRAEIVACTRIMNMENVMGYSGHVSVRSGDGFLIQTVHASRADLQMSDVIMVDYDGKPMPGYEGQNPPSEVHIHSEIYKVRPDVSSIAHYHDDTGSLFTVAEGAKLFPMKNHSVRWASGIPVHPDPSHVATPEMGKALAETLGEHNACLIRAHGEVVVAENVRALLIDCIHFAENADFCYRASMLGKPVPLSEVEIRDFEKHFKRDKHVVKLWKYYIGRGIEEGVIPADVSAMLQ